MRQFMLMPVLFIGLTLPVNTAPQAYPVPLIFRSGILPWLPYFASVQMDSLEEQLGISFSQRQFNYSLRWPEDSAAQPGPYDGLYVDSTRSIYFNQEAVAMPDSLGQVGHSAKGGPFTRIVRHELLHAYFFERARGYGIDDWFEYYRPRAKTNDASMALNIQIEGLAEAPLEPQEADSAYYRILQWPTEPIPDNDGSTAWDLNQRAYRYVGGYQLMEPLVKRFGYPAVVGYTITHPLHRATAPLSRSLKRWQARAFRDLAKPPRR